ncbi:MAG: type I-E CRISPR-associated protein Cas6/Cse3/CasE [Planctomycetes bacterium]|nr:type I-E CRISPR-associated protein Cas6/Cse3/CasE [Planctomycetota bacterium]
MFLSQLTLNPRSRQVRSELAQLYEMHRTLMHAFPEGPRDKAYKARAKYNVLFRADLDSRCNSVVVYVQSTVKPDWSFLHARRDYLLANVAPPKDIAKAYQQLQNGQVLSFRLRANPTKRISKVTTANSELKGKRVGLLREEEQIAWLVRKGRQRESGKSGGFEILAKDVADQSGEFRQVPRVDVRREGKQRGRKKENGRLHATTHLAVRFDGLLRITNANAFRETLAKGIGPAKAFGFGLLSVARA